MSEAELRTRVLQPLFRAMGYRDVDHYHGGAMEQGKDFVMWKPDDFLARVNYAVVAKAGRISGAASGSGSAGEVATQIRQACSDSFRDARTGEYERVTTVLVVASGDIRKEARNAVMNALGPGFAPDVRFIDGDTLWDLVQRFLPAPTALELLAQAQARLAEGSRGREITLGATDGGVSIYIAPAAGGRPDGASGARPAEGADSEGAAGGGEVGAGDAAAGAGTAMPSGDMLRLVFRDSEAGRAAAAQLAAELPKGVPVALHLEDVTQIEWPEVVAPLIAAGSSFTSITVEARTSGDETVPSAADGVHVETAAGLPQFPALLDLVTANGDVARLGPITLSINPKNAVEVFAAAEPGAVVTFENVDRLLPWRLSLAAWPAPSEKRVDFRFAPRIAGQNAKLVADALRFESALAAGGTLHIRDARTGLSLFAAAVPAGTVQADASADILLQLAEALAGIQARLNHPISFPKGASIGGHDVASALETATILATGMAARSYASVTMRVNREAAARMVTMFAGGIAHDLTQVGDETRVVGETSISLGKVAVLLPQVWLSDEELAALPVRIAATGADGFVPVSLNAARDGAPARMYYRDWISSDEVPVGLRPIFALPGQTDSAHGPDGVGGADTGGEPGAV